MNRKKLTLIFVLLELLFVASLFAPLYQVRVETGDVASGYLTFPWLAFNTLQGGIKIAGYVFFVICVAAVLFGIYLFIRSYRDKTGEGDKEDRHFVFGCFVCAIAYAFFGLMGLGTNAFIPMAMAIVYSIASVILILIHHRFLAEY